MRPCVLVFDKVTCLPPNIILFNVPEHTGNIATLKAKGTGILQELAQILLAKPLTIVVQYRLNKTPTIGKKLPILAVLESKSQRKLLFENAKELIDLAPDHKLKGIFIARDMTSLQR